MSARVEDSGCRPARYCGPISSEFPAACNAPDVRRLRIPAAQLFASCLCLLGKLVCAGQHVCSSLTTLVFPAPANHSPSFVSQTSSFSSNALASRIPGAQKRPGKLPFLLKVCPNQAPCQSAQRALCCHLCEKRSAGHRVQREKKSSPEQTPCCRCFHRKAPRKWVPPETPPLLLFECCSASRGPVCRGF